MDSAVPYALYVPTVETFYQEVRRAHEPSRAPAWLMR